MANENDKQDGSALDFSIPKTPSFDIGTDWGRAAHDAEEKHRKHDSEAEVHLCSAIDLLGTLHDSLDNSFDRSDDDLRVMGVLKMIEKHVRRALHRIDLQGIDTGDLFRAYFVLRDGIKTPERDWEKLGNEVHDNVYDTLRCLETWEDDWKPEALEAVAPVAKALANMVDNALKPAAEGCKA